MKNVLSVGMGSHAGVSTSPMAGYLLDGEGNRERDLRVSRLAVL